MKGHADESLGRESLSILSRAPFRIDRVALTVRDLSAVGTFYQCVIGLQRIDESDGVLRLGINDVVLLDLVEDKGATAQQSRFNGLFHTAFLLPAREDLGSWLNYAAEQNFQLQGASDHLVSEAVYLADPEGNGIEIYRDRPDSEWPYRDGQLEMATDPIDMRGLMTAGRLKHWSGFPEGGCVGHVHLQVGELDVADQFYSELLGFDIMCRYPGASFYGSGGYHHQLAGNIWNSRGASRRTSRSTGLRSITLQLRDKIAMIALKTRFHKAGLIRSEAKGSFTVEDPFGIVFQINHAFD